FFQAEDGIRDFHVTGVQTCALPISNSLVVPPAHQPASCRPGRGLCSRLAENSLNELEGEQKRMDLRLAGKRAVITGGSRGIGRRSEERRVGKRRRSGGAWAGELQSR